MTDTSLPLWLFVGATGRVGRMVMRHWHAMPSTALRAVGQSRKPNSSLPDALHWNPADGPKALLDWADQRGPVAGVFLFGGVTPAAGADYSDNARLVSQVLTAAAQAEIPRVLLASSSAVYGLGDGGPIAESASLRPLNPYGQSKIEAEIIAQNVPAFDTCALRIGNVVGADALLVNAARATGAAPLRLDQFADGRGPNRSYISPALLAQVLERLATLPAPLPAVLNIGTPAPVAMADLVQAAGVPWEFSPAPATAHQNITMDCAALQALVPLPPDDCTAAAMVADWRRVQDPV